MFLLLMGVSFSFSTQAAEQKDGGSWFKFALPFETWSPLTSGTSYVAQSMLGSAVPSNELTYTAGAGVLALGWIVYRWAILQRPSWASLIPDKVRHFGNSILETFGFGYLRNKALLREQLEQKVREARRIKDALK